MSTPTEPGPPSDDALAEAVDHVAITRLQHAYADGINRRDWAAVVALFQPGAQVHLDLVDRPVIEVDGPEALVAFVEPAMARFVFFTFVILSSHVELWPDGDRNAADARLAMCEVRIDDDGMESRAFGRYSDHYVRTEVGWRIGARRYRSLARASGDAVVALPPP